MEQKYRYLFGPVPSRRLGMSLGIDLVPHKVCSLNCIYCEVGDTTRLTAIRKEYVPSIKIKEELSRYFKENPSPDFITFSGYGEPTLNSSIGEIVKYIKENYPDTPLALLTNGTLLSHPEVRKELLLVDVVLPSLDAATREVFEKINIPAEGLTVEAHIEGMINFRKEYRGEIWLEVFLLTGYNDNESELEAIKQAILKINPNRVQLNTLDRPGRVIGLAAVTADRLQEIADKWQLKNLEIVAKNFINKDQKAYRHDIETAILTTIERRPCTADDLAQITGTHINEINKYLNVLERDKRVLLLPNKRGIFYKRAPEK